MTMNNDILTLGGRQFSNRLFVGTGKFASDDIMLQAILASESQMITVAMRRVDLDNAASDHTSGAGFAEYRTNVVAGTDIAYCRNVVLRGRLYYEERSK